MNPNIFDLQNKLKTLISAQNHLIKQGAVADCIPALANIEPNQVDVTVATMDGTVIGAGDYQQPFSIQSISKVFGLVMAMNRIGDSLWKRVNMEPSGQPFNSII